MNAYTDVTLDQLMQTLVRFQKTAAEASEKIQNTHHVDTSSKSARNIFFFSFHWCCPVFFGVFPLCMGVCGCFFRRIVIENTTFR